MLDNRCGLSSVFVFVGGLRILIIAIAFNLDSGHRYSASQSLALVPSGLSNESLLAAYAYDPDACWLVMACDYPIVDEEALQQLLKAYEAPVTCFVNGDGYAEPLLAVWNPVALGELAENLRMGASVGPNRAVRAINEKLVEPERMEWLVGANTRDEWERVVGILQKRGDRKWDSDGLSLHDIDMES